MAHIKLQEGLPGIIGPMAFRPQASKHLNNLAEFLLREENSLSRGERELIATYVSYLNDCFFCQNTHGAVAAHYLEKPLDFIESVKTNPAAADISEKMKALLSIAGSVQRGGKQVSAEQVAQAKSAGGTDTEIHDTVLIAAAFCMFNRYVDGLATSAPNDKSFYTNRAPRRAAEGYANFDPTKVA